MVMLMTCCLQVCTVHTLLHLIWWKCQKSLLFLNCLYSYELMCAMWDYLWWFVLLLFYVAIWINALYSVIFSSSSRFNDQRCRKKRRKGYATFKWFVTFILSVHSITNIHGNSCKPTGSTNYKKYSIYIFTQFFSGNGNLQSICSSYSNMSCCALTFYRPASPSR